MNIALTGTNKTVDEWVSSMRQPREWADGLAVAAVALLFDLRLTIVSCDGTFVIDPPEVHAVHTRSLVLGYYLNRHYFACVRGNHKVSFSYLYSLYMYKFFDSHLCLGVCRIVFFIH